MIKPIHGRVLFRSVRRVNRCLLLDGNCYFQREAGLTFRADEIRYGEGSLYGRFCHALKQMVPTIGGLAPALRVQLALGIWSGGLCSATTSGYWLATLRVAGRVHRTSLAGGRQCFSMGFSLTKRSARDAPYLRKAKRMTTQTMMGCFFARLLNVLRKSGGGPPHSTTLRDKLRGDKLHAGKYAYFFQSPPRALIKLMLAAWRESSSCNTSSSWESAVVCAVATSR